MRVKTEDILSLSFQKVKSDQLTLFYLLFGCMVSQPRVFAQSIRHVHLVTLRIFRLILPVSYLCIVKLDLFNVSHVQMHPR